MTFRLGLIVPSSNTTIETELPELFRRREGVSPARFTFHSARMTTTAGAEVMDTSGERSAADLADADCDALAYACLMAMMAAGADGDRRAISRLTEAAGGATEVVSTAGALVDAIRDLGVRRVAMITPYAPALTARVIDFLGAAGIEVVDSISLNITGSREVGRFDPFRLLRLIDGLDLADAEALVLSACVQMPSLPAIELAERRTGLPVITAATATARALLKALRLDPSIPHSGAALRGRAVGLEGLLN